MPFTIEHKQVPVSSCCGKKVSPPIPAIHNKELDEAIAYYKAMAAAAKSEKEKWEGKLSKLDDIAKEGSLVAAKNEILAAMRDIDTYALLTDEELDAIVNGEEEEESGEQEEAETQVDTRPRIEAYNSSLDVRKELRRVSYDTAIHTAIWEDSSTGDSWYTNYPYELGGNVWNNSNISSAPAWGVISLISE